MEKNKEQVTHRNLELNRWVVDGEQNKGKIININDLHNVEVEFDGGTGLYCFVENCEEYVKDLKTPLYYK